MVKPRNCQVELCRVSQQKATGLPEIEIKSERMWDSSGSAKLTNLIKTSIPLPSSKSMNVKECSLPTVALMRTGWWQIWKKEASLGLWFTSVASKQTNSGISSWTVNSFLLILQLQLLQFQTLSRWWHCHGVCSYLDDCPRIEGHAFHNSPPWPCFLSIIAWSLYEQLREGKSWEWRKCTWIF